MANYGFVYCVTNYYMPGLCKIGMTGRPPSQRVAELSASTSVPWDFDLQFYVEVDDAPAVERAIHEGLEDVRVNGSREFFKCGPLVAYNWLRHNADIMTEFVDGGLLYEIHEERERAAGLAKESA